MEKSDSIVALTKALIKAQWELETVAKDTQAYNYKYATLPAVFEEYKKHFLKHGLVVIQQVEGNGLRTTLSHESGEWISSVANLMPIKNDPQAQGSAITYMRRYAIGAICGIMTEEDDDGKKAMPAEHKAEARPATPQEKHPAAGMAPKQDGPKTAIGAIIDQKAKNAGGYVSFKLSDGKGYSTKDSIIIETLEGHKADGTEIGIEYTEPENPKFARTIVGLVQANDKIPF